MWQHKAALYWVSTLCDQKILACTLHADPVFTKIVTCDRNVGQKIQIIWHNIMTNNSQWISAIIEACDINRICQKWVWALLTTNVTCFMHSAALSARMENKQWTSAARNVTICLSQYKNPRYRNGAFFVTIYKFQQTKRQLCKFCTCAWLKIVTMLLCN